MDTEQINERTITDAKDTLYQHQQNLIEEDEVAILDDLEHKMIQDIHNEKL